MKYQVIEAMSIEALEDRVNDLVKNNHGTPIGGVTVSLGVYTGDNTPTFFQTILTR